MVWEPNTSLCWFIGPTSINFSSRWRHFFATHCNLLIVSLYTSAGVDELRLDLCWHDWGNTPKNKQLQRARALRVAWRRPQGNWRCIWTGDEQTNDNNYTWVYLKITFHQPTRRFNEVDVLSIRNRHWTNESWIWVCLKMRDTILLKRNFCKEHADKSADFDTKNMLWGLLR